MNMLSTRRTVGVRRHEVCCPYCAGRFDLFAAPWCAHQNAEASNAETSHTEASKVCPRCGHCLCEHPAYTEPHFWKEAPVAFQQQGFRRLFLFYL